MKAHEYLGGARADDDAWTFDLERKFHGGFGGAFGGIITACTLIAARPLVPDRVVTSVDCRFLRGIPAGTVRVEPRLIHQGRSLASVLVDVTDERGKLAAHSALSFTDPAALTKIDSPSASLAPEGGWKSHADGKRWKMPPGVEIPILETLDPRSVGRSELGSAWAIPVPWDEPLAGAEAACMAADLCVGPPVAGALTDGWVPHPNPDLSLRFAGEVTTPHVVGVGKLERIQAGVAAVSISVFSGAEVVAKGISTSLLLAT